MPDDRMRDVLMTAVPLVFDSTVTAAYAAVTGNVAGAPPVDGVIGQKKVWAFRFDTTCPSDVTDIAVNVDLTTWVLAGGMGAGDSDGISIQLLDLGINAQVPWTATVGGDLYFAPGNNGTVRVGYLGQGGTTSGPEVLMITREQFTAEFERQSRLKKPFGGRTGFVRLQNVRDAAVKAAKKGAN